MDPRPPQADPRGEGLLTGRVVFVTGGSRGIGAAAAELMAGHGAAIGVNYRASAEHANAVVDRIAQAGGRAVAVQGDVADRTQLEAAMKTVRDAFGPIDTLVLNASGHSGRFIPTPLADQDVTSVAHLVGEQLHAVLVPIQLALPDMAAHGSGCVVVVGSGMSQAPYPGFGGPSVAKAAADATIRALAVELGPVGVRLNVVAPGFVATETSEKFVPAQAREELARETPLRRTAVPADVAGAVLLLASDHAGFVTGERLTVTGGAR